MHDHWIYDWEERLREEVPGMSPLLERDIARVREAVLSRNSYLFRNIKLEQLADDISEEMEISRLPKLLWQAAITSGFQNASLFVLRVGKGRLFESRVCSSYPEAWRRRYIEKKYQFVDPVVRLATTRKTAFTFAEAKGSSPIEAEFWADAERFGAGCDGLVIPVELDCEALIVITFSSSLNLTLVENRCKEHVNDLTIVSKLAAEAFSFLARSQPFEKSELSQDELRYLYVLATSDQPAEARLLKPMFGSAVSVEQSIRQKLGVKSILQAVAIASRENFFADLDFNDFDVNPLCRRLHGWDFIESVNAEIDDVSVSASNEASKCED